VSRPGRSPGLFAPGEEKKVGASARYVAHVFGGRLYKTTHDGFPVVGSWTGSAKNAPSEWAELSEFGSVESVMLQFGMNRTVTILMTKRPDVVEVER
jgi:hypothetical protein